MSKGKKQAPVNVMTGSGEPDLVDRIFEYIFNDSSMSEAVKKIAEEQEGTEKVKQLKDRVRKSFAGEMVYIRSTMPKDEMTRRVLELFNGRNAMEVARVLKISRASVYRSIKQAG